MFYTIRYFLLLNSLLLSACGVPPGLFSDEESPDDSYTAPPNNPPVIYSLTLSPDSAYTNTDIVANVISSDEDNDYLTTTYKWFVNDVEITDAYTDTLFNNRFSKEDTVKLEVTVSDYNNSTTETASIIIQNTSPQATLSLSPELAYTNTDIVSLLDTTDIDDDLLSYNYIWSVNNIIVNTETSSTLPSSNFLKGDQIKLEVEVSDSTESIHLTKSLTVFDTAPIISLATQAPTEINYGSLVQFSVSSSDIDGDTPTYSIHHGPNGMVINQDGTVTWTPSGPLFDTDTEFNWGITASSGPDANNTIEGSINVTDNNRLRPLSRGKFDVPSSKSKFILADMNNDGQKEILSADSLDTNNRSSTGQRLSITAITGNTYRQLWSYPFDLADRDGSITSLAVHDINNDNYPEIFIGTGHSSLTTTDQSHQPKIIIIDGQSKIILKSVTFTGRAIALSVVDLNNDSNPELLTVLANDYGLPSRLDIRDLTTLESRWSSSNIRGSLGNIDSDPEPELISSSGLVYDYDGTGFVASWSYNTEANGFGSFTIGDIDNDGDNEIFAMPDSTYIHIVHSETEATILNYPGLPYTSTLFGSAFFIADIDNDGENELIGDDIKAFSYSTAPTPTLTEKWSQYTPEADVRYLAFTDYDNDSSNELFWTSSTRTTGPDQLFISSFNQTNQTLVQEWTHNYPVSFNGYFRGGYLVNTSLTNKELIFASTEIDNSYSETRLIKMNPVTGDLSFSPGLGNNTYSTVSICPADYDNDGIDEVFVGTGQGYSPNLSIYDPGLNFSSLAYTETNLATIDQITSADINNDGHLDLVALGRLSYFYIYDVFNSTLLWKGTSGSELISESNRDIHVTDLNNDGSDEIIILTTENLYIHSKDLNGNISLVKSISVKNGRLLGVGHIDGDNQLDITVVHSNQDESMAQITTYSPELVEQYNFTTDLFIAGLQIEEFGEFPKNFTVSVVTYNQYPHSEGYIGIINPKTGGEVMRSPLLSMPSPKAIQYVDVDSDGIPEISYGTKDSLNITR